MQESTQPSSFARPSNPVPQAFYDQSGLACKPLLNRPVSRLVFAVCFSLSLNCSDFFCAALSNGFVSLHLLIMKTVRPLFPCLCFYCPRRVCLFIFTTCHPTTRHHHLIPVHLIDRCKRRAVDHEQLHILPLVSVFRFAIPHLVIGIAMRKSDITLISPHSMTRHYLLLEHRITCTVLLFLI